MRHQATEINTFAQVSENNLTTDIDIYLKVVVKGTDLIVRASQLIFECLPVIYPLMNKMHDQASFQETEFPSKSLCIGRNIS